jgi:hypothetical protein
MEAELTPTAVPTPALPTGTPGKVEFTSKNAMEITYSIFSGTLCELTV